MSTAVQRGSLSQLVVPSALLVVLTGLLAVQTGLVRMPDTAPTLKGPETVRILGRSFSYRASGEFLQNGATVDGPLLHAYRSQPLDIMVYQVSAADYSRCVDEGECEKAEPRFRVAGDVPVTGVSFDDGNDYAAWLSRRTGATWRLPTVEEWVFAAGSRAVDDALGISTSSDDPAQRWLLSYEKDAALSRDRPAGPRLLGSFGANEYGVADLSAAVWEWTTTCVTRTTLDPSGVALSRVESCGTRYLEGRHRTQMSSFVRDAIAGGCSVGDLPDNLGFRLVREPHWTERVAAWAAAL